MEIRDLRFFCKVAELEHVSKAAENLGTSQPFLTKIIGQLENELEVKLFDKVNRRLKLNQNGKFFYVRASKILADLDSLVDDMDELADKQQRDIRLMCDSTGYSTGIMLAYKKQNPHNMISIKYSDRAHIIDSLVTGEADFAFCTPPIVPSESIHIKTELVFAEKGCILLPPGDPLIGKKSLTFQDLKGHPMVAPPIGAGIRNNMNTYFKRENYTPNIVCESMDINLLIGAALNGQGFVAIPHHYMNDPQFGKYCSEIGEPDMAPEIGLSYNVSRSGQASTEKFVELIKEYFSTLE
ncbi:MAG: LysR family transcriptional regulator [Oscillospiraceae bacterium]